MNIFQPINYCWDKPWLNSAAAYNVDSVLKMGGRIEIEVRGGADFNHAARSVLAPSRSYGQQASLLAIHQRPHLLVIDAPWNGDSTGSGYHQEALDLNVSRYARHAMQAVAHFAGKGANIVAVQVFNESDYAKWYYSHGRWDEWLEFQVDVTRAIAAAVDLPIVCGGQHGKDTHGGKQTVVSKLIEEGLFSDGTVRYAAVHGNGKDIEHVVAEIQWLRNRGLKVLVTEDRGRGWLSHDSDTRAPLCLSAGAEAYFTLGLQRHVNQDPVRFPPENELNLWGVVVKHSRKTGAAFTCVGFLEDQWALLLTACETVGQWDGNDDDLLPMDGSEPPVEPPTDPPTVPMLEQAWDARCQQFAAHFETLALKTKIKYGVELAAPRASVLKSDVEAREDFEREVDRLGRHYEEIEEARSAPVRKKIRELMDKNEEMVRALEGGDG
jgi:hypothetical protein